jgi:PAS domain S-box-containing protein
MSGSHVAEVEGLHREIETLQMRNEALLRRALDAEHVMEAFAHGEVDAVTLGASATPVLLRAAQESQRASQQLLRAIFDGAMEPMVLTNADRKYVDANSAACELYGFPLDQLIGRSVAEFIGPELTDDTAYRRLREQGHMRGRFTLERRDGTQRLLEFSSVANVSPGLDLSVMRDITERNAMEAAVARSEARFRTLTEKSADVITIVDRDGALQYVSPQMTQMLGWTPEELIALGDRANYVLPEDRPRVAIAHERVLHEAGEIVVAFRAVHRDGSIRSLEASARNLCADPNVGAIVTNIRDVTARVVAEAASREDHRRLEEAQAIAHVGSWTSGGQWHDAVVWSRECYRIFGVPEGTTVTVESFFACIATTKNACVRRAGMRGPGTRHTTSHTR